ncbi:hypothetical protein LTR37_003139 [Vermiconidia calcicola]|uniref:Uncharacterized protein n=1 Tax=Vermiconidia calcicola TaxID=1690605 RepID=A0ACC3NRD8_9PEZI|nr:hypothetical protein LTR37_003139 [Vermiconidia calcicola]
MNVPTAPSDRALRLATIFAWVPAVAFLIPYGALTGNWFPTVALVPMTVSLCYGLIVTFDSKHIKLNHDNIHVRGRAYEISWLVDTICALLLFAFLIPGWINLDNERSWWSTGRITVVGTYGTVPLMVNCAIHAFFALRGFGGLRKCFHDMFSSPSCVHCQNERFAPPQCVVAIDGGKGGAGHGPFDTTSAGLEKALPVAVAERTS